MNLIEYLLQKRICFAVVAANSFGGIADFFVIVHKSDYERVKDRFCKSHTYRDCHTHDLEGEDYKAFKRLQETFVSKDLENDNGSAYELKDNSFAQHRKRMLEC